MTREEAKQKIYNASKEDRSSPKNCIHLLYLHGFIDQIFDDHEAQLKAKDEDLKLAMDLSEHMIDELKTERGIKEYLAKELKANSEEIERLKEIINTSIEEIEYAIIRPQYVEVYLNNAISFLKDNK